MNDLNKFKKSIGDFQILSRRLTPSTNPKSLVCSNRRYRHMAQWCLDHALFIKNYDLIIENYDFTNIDQLAQFMYPNTILMSNLFKGKRINTCHELNPALTLFHEMRHYYQWKTNMFDFIIPTKKKKFINHNMNRHKSQSGFIEIYESLPWEIDADNFAMSAYEQYTKYLLQQHK